MKWSVFGGDEGELIGKKGAFIETGTPQPEKKKKRIKNNKKKKKPKNKITSKIYK